MTPFIQLPVSLQDHLLGVLAFIIYLQMAGIAAAYVWTRSRRQMLPFVLLFLFHLALLVLMTAGRGYFSLGEHRYPLAFRLIQCPLNVILLYLLAAALLDLFLLYRLWRLYQRSITKNSIKESADSMPAGLCFCQPDGLPLLVNLRMQEISHAYTGVSVQNGLEFWNHLTAASGRGEIVRGGAQPVVKLADGRVYSFARSAIRLKDKEMMEIVALDTTEQYQLSQKLQQENEELDAMNGRLRQYSVEADALTRSEEILAAKIRIHDELGNALVATRYYLAKGAQRPQPEALLEMWHQCMELFTKAGMPEKTAGVREQLEAAAAAAGVRIQMEGKFPEEDAPAARLLLNASRECLTNAVRHAAADCLDIRISARDSFYDAVFENNGAPPAKTIAEGGGLSSLRWRIERAGGTMNVLSMPKFQLLLSIPKGSERL
jgi:signal transduction histidine kinase